MLVWTCLIANSDKNTKESMKKEFSLKSSSVSVQVRRNTLYSKSYDSWNTRQCIQKARAPTWQDEILDNITEYRHNCGFWNVRGWKAYIQLDNHKLRGECFLLNNLDIIGVAETHSHGYQCLYLSGYTVGRNTFLSSPYVCFIIVYICDLFVSRDDPLMN